MGLAFPLVDGARQFLLGGLNWLVDSFNDRDLGLLNSVKYDSSLITSQRETLCKVRVQCILAGHFICTAKVV